MPGPWHTSKHGGGDPLTWEAGQRASPITCQTCHYETVDPARIRPDGFFYFDAGGDYDLRPDGDATRGTNSSWLAMQCGTCHGGESGGGRALPLRHVNGRREVVFDRRATLPDGYATGLPALATSEPVRPYYMTKRGTRVYALTAADCSASPQPSCGVAADVAVRASAAGAEPRAVLTFTLEHAAWDPATKTCSSIACHLEHQAQVEAGEKGPLRWGAPYAWDPSCTGCHAL
jgi:predicted CxxxxCH...CXXCH cytochrome family protein